MTNPVIVKKSGGNFSLIGAWLTARSYQHPRRGLGRKKQLKAVKAMLFSIAVCGALFINFSSEFKGSAIRNAKV